MVRELPDKAKVIYEQDCNFYRYQDGQRWGRFRVAMTIEAAFLFAGYNVDGLSDLQRLAVVFFGAVLVVALFEASKRDSINAAGHLSRIKKYERRLRYTKTNASSIPGKTLADIAIVITYIFNLGVVGDRLYGFLLCVGMIK